MPHLVRIYGVTSPIHGPPCQHPPCKASISAVTSGALAPVTAIVRVHSTLHRTTVSPVLRPQQWRSPDASRVGRGNRSTMRHVVVLAGYSAQVLHPYPYPFPSQKEPWGGVRDPKAPCLRPRAPGVPVAPLLYTSQAIVRYEKLADTVIEDNLDGKPSLGRLEVCPSVNPRVRSHVNIWYRREVSDAQTPTLQFCEIHRRLCSPSWCAGSGLLHPRARARVCVPP